MRNPIAKSVRRIRPQAVPGVRNPPPNTEDWDDDGQYFCTRCATLCPPGRVPAASVEDCWKMAVYITTDPRTKQIAMCVPGKDTSDEATKNKTGVAEGSEDR